MSDDDMETEHSDGDDDEFDHDLVGTRYTNILINPANDYFSVCESQKMSSFCIYLSVC